jgi:hypothetical protein
VIAFLIVPLVFIVVLIGIPVAVLAVQLRRTATQRIVLRGGMLEISDGVSGVLKGMPVDDIGAVVTVAKSPYAGTTGSSGIWTWGGLILLDRAGKVVRHLTGIPGAPLPLDEIAASIPAPVHQHFARGSRREFLRQFPRSLRFGQFWGATRWALTITVFACVVVPVLVVLVGFTVAIATTLAGTMPA